jgi:hypothetical protein
MAISGVARLQGEWPAEPFSTPLDTPHHIGYGLIPHLCRLLNSLGEFHDQGDNVKPVKKVTSSNA